MAKTILTLIRLMKRHNLTAAEVAKLIRVSQSAVEKWRLGEGAPGHRNMPESSLELLKIKLKK